MSKRHEITEEQWKRIEAVLPNKKLVGRPGGDVKTFLNAVVWIAKTGSPWRDLPERFGKWNLIYQRFSYWSVQGYFSAVFAALKTDMDQQEVMIDSTVIKCHQHSSGAKKNMVLNKLANLPVE